MNTAIDLILIKDSEGFYVIEENYYYPKTPGVASNVCTKSEHVWMESEVITTQRTQFLSIPKMGQPCDFITGGTAFLRETKKICTNCGSTLTLLEQKV